MQTKKSLRVNRVQLTNGRIMEEYPDGPCIIYSGAEIVDTTKPSFISGRTTKGKKTNKKNPKVSK